MKELFEEIQLLNGFQYNKKDKKTQLLCAISKLGEEYGELVMEVNKFTGVKQSKMSIAHTKEELADVLQNIFSIADLYNITFEDLQKELKKKNKKWKHKLDS